MACVYIFRHGKENKFKIGRTKKSAKIRLKDLQTGNPDLTIFDVIETEYDTAVEKYMHRRLATKKIINGSSSDEFYAVSVAELQPIIAETHDYNREYLPTIEQADELGAEEPDGSVKEPGNAAVAMHQELLEIEEKMARLASRSEYLVAEIKITMGTASELRESRHGKTLHTIGSTRRRSKLNTPTSMKNILRRRSAGCSSLKNSRE
jgi:hypothetical protein